MMIRNKNFAVDLTNVIPYGILLLLIAGCNTPRPYNAGAGRQLNPKQIQMKDLRGNVTKPLFQKQRVVTIKKQAVQDNHGSLWNAADKRNFLFSDPQNVHLGQTIVVYLPKNDAPDTEPKKTTPPSEKADKALKSKEKNVPGEKTTEKPDETLANIENAAKAINELEQSLQSSNGTISPFLPKYIKAKVIEVHPIHGITLQYRRYSKTPMEEKFLIITANIPQDIISPERKVSVDDFREISVTQNVNNEVKTSSAIGWTPEFTEMIQNFGGALTAKEKQILAKQDLLHSSKKDLLKRIKAVQKNHQQLTDRHQKILEERKLFEEEKIKSLQAKKATSAEAVDKKGVENTENADLTGNRENKNRLD